MLVFTLAVEVPAFGSEPPTTPWPRIAITWRCCGTMRHIEVGQSAFAAIQEIIASLKADPATDWSTIDIEALRQRLIDMDDVTLRAHSRAANQEDGGLDFIAAGEKAKPPPRSAIALSHAAEMNRLGGWTYVGDGHGRTAPDFASPFPRRTSPN